MKVFNKTRNIVLSEDCGIADSFLSRLRGLMLSKNRDLLLVSPREDVASSTIHMLFMLYPIDVLWIGEDMRVVDMAGQLPPFSPLKPATWRTYKPNSPAKYVLELGLGRLLDTGIGDELAFE